MQDARLDPLLLTAMSLPSKLFTWSRLPSIEAARRPSEDGTKEDDDDDEKENV
jgi:hypothetical protein